MKNFLALLASLCMVFAFATACNKDKDGNGSFWKPSTGTSQSGGDKEPDNGGDDGNRDEDDEPWTGFY